ARPNRAPAKDVRALPLEYERGAEDPEYGAGRADGHRVRSEDERAGRPGEARDEVDDQEPRPAEILLYRRPHPVEEEHVEPEMDRPVVEKRRRDQAPPVAVGDQRPEERSFLKDLAADAVDRAARSELEQVDADVDPDQRSSHKPRRAGGREAPDAAPHARDALCPAGMLRTALPDRSRRHALGADRPPAFGAREIGLPIGMAVAPHRGGHGSP